jgi:hypothetical protein
MRALVVTLQHRQYGLAEASFMKAFRYWKNCQPDAHFAHIRLWGNEPIALDHAERHRFDLGHEIVTQKYNEARNIFLAGNWDTLITLEDDMVIPEDGFIRLQNALNDGADVVYSLYSWRHDLFFMPQAKLSAYVMLTQNDGRSIGMYRERLEAAWDKVIDVRGVGLMIGLDPTGDARALAAALLARGLTTSPTVTGVIRLVPPLIIDQNHVAEALAIIEATLKE